jgi:DNA-binding CsgD family transcriptional regulator
MTDSTDSLTEREKQVLRLLAASHDAKSAAKHLGLSVHTVNERLRTARRKLGVSSSRAAARFLSQAEQGAPKLFVDLDLGEGAEPVIVEKSRPAIRYSGRYWAWIAGGLFMSAAILTLVVTLLRADVADPGIPPSLPLAVPSDSPAASGIAPMADSVPKTRPATSAARPASPSVAGRLKAPDAATDQARTWLALLDQDDWNESWRTASSIFQSRTTQEAWQSMGREMRRPVQPVNRVEQYATLSNSSVIIQYQSTSDGGTRAIETIVLILEGRWKVSAYFVHETPGRAGRPAP